MRNLILTLGVAITALMVGTPVRAEEPKSSPTKPTVTDKDWQQFGEWLNPLGFIQRMREAEARQRATNNLKQLQKALHDYAAQGPGPRANGAQPIQPNWYQYLLPYIEQNNVYSAFTPNRLGIKWESAGEALQAQLALTANKGLLITEVDGSSAAAKAGLKRYDILLQWDGKDVTGKPADFLETLNKAPEKKDIAVRVLRGGKEVEVKGISLPAAGPTPIRTYISPDSIRDGTSNTLLIGDAWRYGAWAPNSNWATTVQPSEAQSKVFTTTFRQDDRFTARYQEGTLSITITGQMKNDAATVKAVKVIDGAIEHRYDSIDKTPEEYRDKARDLVRAAEKNQDRIQIQK